MKTEFNYIIEFCMVIYYNFNNFIFQKIMYFNHKLYNKNIYWIIKFYIVTYYFNIDSLYIKVNMKYNFNYYSFKYLLSNFNKSTNFSNFC